MPKMSSYQRLLFVSVAYIFVAGVWSAPAIDTVSQSVEGKLGGQVEFTCHVTGLSNTQQVVWMFVDHNITISANTDIHVKDGESKYEIFKPQDVTTYWNLRVNRLEAADEGSYKCYVQGFADSANVVHHLDIIDAPTRPSVSSDYDVTGCCKERNVTCTIAICKSNYTSTELMQVFTSGTECIDKELLDVVICGQGGRNHMGCCMRSGVPDGCLPLCGGVYDPERHTDFSTCIPIVTKIQTCFIEGRAFFPSPPVSVSAAAISEYQVMVSWKPPLENVEAVTGYRVFYREAGTEHYQKTMPLGTSEPFYQVSDLKRNTEYQFNVVALATAGSSQPSYTVRVFTKSDVPDINNITQTVADCCQHNGIQDDCLTYCKPSAYRATIHPDAYSKCFGDLNTIYQCITGQGNHTPCCERMNVPINCTPLCEGQVSTDWNIIQCFMYLPVISACVQENSGLLPAPPMNTRLVPGSLTSDAVTIQWDAPSTSYGLTYTVSWQPFKALDKTWTSVNVLTGTSHTITGLRSATAYNVQVSTMNDKGSSLPELTLIIVTEGISSVVEKTYNETECCLSKGVGQDCIHICDHSFRLSADILTEGLKCYQDILPMLQCASDLRNHTDCCAKRYVPPQCLGVCAIDRDYSETDLLGFIYCTDYIGDISKCMNEGKQILPMIPEQFRVKLKTKTSITLDWQKPPGPVVSGYKVGYSEGTVDSESWDWTYITTNETFVVVDHLKAGVPYIFQVSSMNLVGTSLPSYMLKDSLPRVVYDKPLDWTKVWQNRTDCCARNNVSAACQGSCQGAAFDQKQCYNQLDKLVACAADGRNHSACCSRYPEFPDICLPYCQGLTPPQSAQYAHCLLYVDTMYTCFSEGQGLLPTPPRNVYVSDYDSYHINLAWQPPATNCDANSCRYTALIWREGSVMKEVFKKIVPSGHVSYTFTDLIPSTLYEMTVVATNANGSSVPATEISVRTQSSASKSITVSQYPNGIIDIGSSVELGCVVANTYFFRVQWTFNDKEMSLGNTYTISAVDEHSAGNYTCHFDIGDGMRLNKSLTLNVKYTPKPMEFTADSVLPGNQQDADLTCRFQGFPDIVSWTKEGTSLQDPAKYLLQPLRYDFGTGNTYGSLRVLNVEKTDFGQYTCVGFNKHGSKRLTGDFKYDLYPTGATPTKPPQANVSECCRQLGVSETCASRICTFAIDLAGVASDPSLAACLFDIDTFLVCAADGRDHTSCCQGKGVQEYCLPICAGKSPSFTDSDQLYQCMVHDEDILSCVQDGHKFIPSAPQSVSAEQDFTRIKVNWDKPSKNPGLVSLYNVYWTEGATTDHHIVSKNLRAFYIDGIEKNKTYNIWALAVNDFGQSSKSNVATIMITRIPPSAPKNVAGTVVDVNNIRVTWQRSQSENTSGYAVTYGPENSKGTIKPITVRTGATETRLENLLFDTTYIIYVTAFNQDGAGAMSNKISVLTGKNPDAQGGAMAAPRKSSSNKTGLAVGLTIGLLLLLTIAVLGFLMFRRYKSAKNVPSETVAFENPQYGPKVTGLPGEGASEDNQYSYGHLQEEPQTNNLYSSIERSNGQSQETPATLHLERQT